MYYCLFFFKQKTAYEMRIGDWSSDVCASDLEYGIDPTGIGTQLGLIVLGTPAEAAVPDVPVIEPAAAATVAKHDANYRTDSMSLTLAPGKGADIKAHMNQGDTFVFHWTADAAVAVDMHGERADAAKDEYTSYWNVIGRAHV